MTMLHHSWKHDGTFLQNLFLPARDSQSCEPLCEAGLEGYMLFGVDFTPFVTKLASELMDQAVFDICS